MDSMKTGSVLGEIAISRGDLEEAPMYSKDPKD
jgi:hypothetical protein